MDLNKLLSILADGQFHSGSELGVHLGVSRTAVWKAMPLLEQFGIAVEVIKGKGYRIGAGLDLIDLELVKAHLLAKTLAKVHMSVLLSCRSTNDYLLNDECGSNGSIYRVCFSEHQTAGKGRRGREWVSPFAKNLLFSSAFNLQGGVDVLAGLSLVVGIAVGKAIKKLGVDNVKIKWPNDVYIDDKKIAGILLELTGEATTSWKVVCGIGLNVLMGQNDGAQINQEWCSLEGYIKVKRSDVAGVVLSSLLEHLELFKQKGFKKFMGEWEVFDWLSGKQIVIMPSGLTGVAKGVNKQGALLIETLTGIEEVNAGEVSVRCL